MKTKYFLILAFLAVLGIPTTIFAQNLEVEGLTELKGGALSNPLNIFTTGTSNYTTVTNTNGYRGYYGTYTGVDDMDFGTGGGNAVGKVHLVLNASPQLTIVPGGNVGIGNQTPSDKLHVNGNIRLDGTGTRILSFYNGGTNTSYFRQFSSGLIQQVNLTTNDTEFWTNSGNTKALDLDSDGVARSPYGRYGGNTDGLAWRFGVNGTSIFRGNESNGTTSGGINIISGSQSMWLDGNEIDVEVDNLSLNYNTNQPIVMRNTEVRADVNVGHSSGGGNTMGFSIENQEANNNWWTFYVLNNGGDFQLYKNGSMRGSFDEVSGAYTATSDRKLKKDIVDMGSVLDKVMQSQPRNYKFKADENNRTYVGFIAQEMETLFPEVVYKNTVGDTSDEIYTMDYSSISSIAIQAIKEQQVIINDLKAQLDQIQIQLNALTKD